LLTKTEITLPVTNLPLELLTKTINNTVSDKPTAGVVDKDDNKTASDKAIAGVVDKDNN
jgi:hypothetical protein